MRAQITSLQAGHQGERGFTLTELLISLMVFLVITGSVAALVGKSQNIFRAEQGVSEMDQNARLLMDFLTRDIQQSKENGLGLGPKFRSIYSHNGLEGKTDEMTLISSATDSRVPAAALPLTAAKPLPFSVRDGYVELLPNGASDLEAADVVASLEGGETFIVSTTLPGGSVQFDFLKVTGASVTHEGFIGLNFVPVDQPGITPEIPFGSVYENGAFTLRPVTVKRYYVDRGEEKHNPEFSLSVNGGEPITIARNVVAFQLRYLEVRDGEVEGQWVKEQNISPAYKTIAVEVTMTARTEIRNDDQAERLITLASVIRPRSTPGFGPSGEGGSGGSSPGLPWGEGDPDDPWGGGPGGGVGGGDPWGGPGNGGRTGAGMPGAGGPGFGNPGLSNGGYRHETRRVGKQPRLGERLNSDW